MQSVAKRELSRRILMRLIFLWSTWDWKIFPQKSYIYIQTPTTEREAEE